MTDAHADAHGFARRIEQYTQAIELAGYGAMTIYYRARHLKRFAAWCEERGLTRPGEVTRAVIERFHRHLIVHRTKKGEALKAVSRFGVIIALRGFFRWLSKQNLILYNPAADVDVPKCRPNPKPVLTAQEVERVLNQLDVSTPLGLRNRAIMEVLYSTGIRRMELAKLKISDVDMERGIVYVEEGKGGKSRFVPVGERACLWVRKYVEESRPRIVVPPDNGTLFLGATGRPIRGDAVTHAVARTMERADVAKKGGPHLFRHTCATLMLENGADIRFIQALLGHAHLNSTQIYTQVAIRKLKDIHTATHPAKLYNTDTAAKAFDTQTEAG